MLEPVEEVCEEPLTVDSVPGSPNATPAWAVQLPGMLLFLYHPTAFDGQDAVANFPVERQ